ncbi:F-box protein At5g39450 [Cucurbita pepo subsp. pepo]|uniref:F-box protein At5g39450 n=1 Tax=Cucurbita pepo subsp. pepo TaxID=3664 RepID=UPI000C9D2931|nr:F-box protein At5g39450 [Cucurbita pepo subsp. pepo]XP_023517885.1 F-box protein At5g39450 [Cucurbita pepo subsp. pepo]XP_023517886.1 F-box protein At5g39450 [Cucurbita pepo subsp. pepo]
MSTEVCGSSLLLSLPDDVLSTVSRSLSPRDLCNLSLCCRDLHDSVASEKIWLTQCEMVGILAAKDLMDWRTGMASYKALCRFLSSVEPLMGIWVHQNPELGNVVYVMPGFVSVVGCRIIPQELGPLGIEDGPILWAPVFEILGDADGIPSFFLHGKKEGIDYFYPGLVKAVDKSCNVLLLEVETKSHRNGYNNLSHSKSFVNHSDQEARNVCRSNSDLSRSRKVFGEPEAKVSFDQLAFCDRRQLLETVMNQVRVKVSSRVAGPLFPRLRDEVNFDEDMAVLSERRSVLMQYCKVGGSQLSETGSSELLPDPTQLELSKLKKSVDGSSGLQKSINRDDDHQVKCGKKKTLGRYLRQSLNQILEKSGFINDSKGMLKNNCSCSVMNKYVKLEEFLQSSDTIGLALHASTKKLSSYRGWPNMHENRFALYKLPMRVPTAEQEYAGLWGGTFGWPPGKPTEDKPGKALFFLLLSYEKSQGQVFLIATKILEGTHYVLHPNGSAMFRVNINEPSVDPFPWESDGDLFPVNIQHTFSGEGIANGYGFRYPGSKPGSLYVFQNGQLAFIWKESKSVLTLQRLNLQELLKKGERVPPLQPTDNFSYLTKSYSNVFNGFPNTSTSFSLPRETCS